MTIGILGGGQLGYMLALAGYPLDFHFRFLDPSPQAPVGRIAPRVTAEYTDYEALDRFAHGLALVLPCFLVVHAEEQLGAGRKLKC